MALCSWSKWKSMVASLRARVTPALCLGCGACVAVCPENAIDVNGWTLEQYEAMVDRFVADDAAA